MPKRLNPPFQDSELIIGLVAPVGTDFDRFQRSLERTVARFDYSFNSIRLSDLAQHFRVERQKRERGSKEFVRITELMNAGNYLRFSSRKGGLLALAAAQAILLARNAAGRLRPRTAHVIRSLKHPEEVRTLRRIYGSGFYLIGITIDQDERRRHLRENRGCSTNEIDKLLERDEHEEDPACVGLDGENYGQRTRDTFQLADAFIPLKSTKALDRFFNLIFGHPYETPGKDEYPMFLAFSAALRSADLSRQVGAVVVSQQGDIVAVGANDVPRPGGGLYWPGADDDRDHARGEDSNERQRDVIIESVLKALRPANEALSKWITDGKAKLKGSPVMDITEYGRATHAEMEAILSCARSGMSPRNGTLYSTTFPCHNCAKHIVAGGIKRVVYVEPYPKSQALTLFADSVRLPNSPSYRSTPGKGPNRGRREHNDPRVLFEPFEGVGPRRFFDLFSIGLGSGTRLKRKQAGAIINWVAKSAVIRVPLDPNSYLDRELAATEELVGLTDERTRRSK
jgi:deoxycytidylate deaminase